MALFLRQVKTNSGPKGENHLSIYSRSPVDSSLSSTDWWQLLITYMWCCCWWAPPAGGSGGFWQCLASGWCLRGTGTCCGPRTRRHLRSLWRRDRGETGQSQRLRESLHTFNKDRFLSTLRYVNTPWRGLSVLNFLGGFHFHMRIDEGRWWGWRTGRTGDLGTNTCGDVCCPSVARTKPHHVVGINNIHLLFCCFSHPFLSTQSAKRINYALMLS